MIFLVILLCITLWRRGEYLLDNIQLFDKIEESVRPVGGEGRHAPEEEGGPEEGVGGEQPGHHHQHLLRQAQAPVHQPVAQPPQPGLHTASLG